MITIFRADALRLKLVQHAVAAGRTGSCVPSAALAATALRTFNTMGVTGGPIFDIASEVFANWPATVRYTDIDVVFSNDVVIGSEGSTFTIGLSDVLAHADDMSSALALAAFDGCSLADIAVHDGATRSVLVVNNLSGVRSEVASITADIARQISDAASSSFAHLVSRLAAHEKSERLVEVIDQTVLPRVHVDGLNSLALQLLEHDVAARLVRNIDNTSLRHAAFMLALRSGLCSGDLKVVPGYESVTVDIERNYSSSMFLFGVQDTSGNEAVDISFAASR